MARTFSFPHPVLGNRDDVEGVFTFRPSVKEDRQALICRFDAEFKLTNEELEKEIEDHRAVFQLRITCERTCLRRSFPAEPGSSRISGIEVPSGDLWGKVEIEGLLVAADDIPEYRPSGIHPDYGDGVFHVGASQILAETEEWTTNIDVDYDPLQSPVGTILEVDGGAQGDIHEVDYTQDKILVRLPPVTYERYERLKKRRTSIIISLIAVPVFTDAIQQYRAEEPDEDIEGTAWYSRLGEIYEARRDELERLEPHEAAEKLLNGKLGLHTGHALARAFNELDDLDQAAQEERE